jgi:prepilin-type N-terminal cleavage/methylation domain-containing protein
MRQFIHKRLTKNLGFTTVELLVVIVVIGILVGIVYFSGQGFLKKGADTAAKGNISKVGLSLQSYYNKNGEYPTPIINPSSEGSTPTAKDFLESNLKTSISLSNEKEVIRYYGVSTNSANAGNFCLEIFSNQYNDYNIEYYISTKTTVPTSGSCPSKSTVSAASMW